MDRSQCIHLIQAYKNYPILWNSRTKNYHNKNKREDAWREIGESLQLPISQLKQKMKGLMGTFRSEKSRENKSRVTGSGSEDVYHSKWFGYIYFDFLMDKDIPNATLDTMSSQVPQEQGTEEYPPSQNTGSSSQQETADTLAPTTSSSQQETADTLAPTTSSSQQETADIVAPTTSCSSETPKKPSKKRKRGESDPDVKLLNEAFQVLRSSNEVGQQLVTDSYFSYGQYLANELRKYDSTTLSYIKRSFSNILFDADQGTLICRYNTPQMSSASASPVFSNQPSPHPVMYDFENPFLTDMTSGVTSNND